MVHECPDHLAMLTLSAVETCHWYKSLRKTNNNNNYIIIFIPVWMWKQMEETVSTVMFIHMKAVCWVKSTYSGRECTLFGTWCILFFISCLTNFLSFFTPLPLMHLNSNKSKNLLLQSYMRATACTWIIYSKCLRAICIDIDFKSTFSMCFASFDSIIWVYGSIIYL